VYDTVKSLTYKAQKVFEFASIYQQRRTNALLQDGFGTLIDAVGSLGTAINSSINALSDRVTLSLDDIKGTVQDSAQRQIDEAAIASDRQYKQSIEATQRQAKSEKAIIKSQKQQTRILKEIKEGQDV